MQHCRPQPLYLASHAVRPSNSPEDRWPARRIGRYGFANPGHRDTTPHNASQIDVVFTLIAIGGIANDYA